MNDPERIRMKIDMCKWHMLCEQAGIDPDTADATALGVLLKTVQAGGYLAKVAGAGLTHGGIRKGYTEPDGTQQWHVTDPAGSWSDGTFRVGLNTDGTYTCDCGKWTWKTRWCTHGEAVLKHVAPTLDDYRRAVEDNLPDDLGA